MDKMMMRRWMEEMERVGLTIAGHHDPQYADVMARELADLRSGALPMDAACASVTDRPDTPPPSAWPSVSRIRKETRAEVVAEIHRILNDAKTASVIASALRGREDFTVVDVLIGASAFIAGHMGKSE